jgi:hypothetical protein
MLPKKSLDDLSQPAREYNEMAKLKITVSAGSVGLLHELLARTLSLSWNKSCVAAIGSKKLSDFFLSLYFVKVSAPDVSPLLTRLLCKIKYEKKLVEAFETQITYN